MSIIVVKLFIYRIYLFIMFFFLFLFLLRSNMELIGLITNKFCYQQKKKSTILQQPNNHEKNNIDQVEIKMKKQNFQPHPQPQSCIDIGKYKFIPPSKLLKTKAPTILTPSNASNASSSGHSSIHIQTVLQSNANMNKNISSHFHSLMECHNYDEPMTQQQAVKKSSIINIQQDNSHKNNRENKCNKQNKKEQKMQRSISNPKLQTSSSGTNSRHTLLSNKSPPIAEVEQTRQTQIEKLTQCIHQLQQKQASNKKQITMLIENSKQLENKLAISEVLINKKNKMLTTQQSKMSELENMVHEKCQEHTLIVDSLKKVISSQLFKINQLKRKLNRVHKIRNEGTEVPGLQEEQISYQDSEDSIHFMRPEMSKLKMIHQELKNIQKEKNKNGIYRKNYGNEKINNNKEIVMERREKNTKISNKTLNSAQQSEQPDNSCKKQSKTPDFGARTPSYCKGQDNLINEKEQQAYEQLECSIDGDNDIENVNLTLSRISQSVEQDFETSRQNIQIEETSQHSIINKNSTTNTVNTYTNQSNQNNNMKNTADREYTHQQLLDQIDQYLSKRIVQPLQRK